jgi:oxygen-dependent protoporphyrinogen oxidase
MSSVSSDPPLDAVVVGGGIAGLTAAWHLRNRRILLLEREERVGGRMFSEASGDYWLNYGAHLFPGRGSVVDELLTSVGLRTVPIPGTKLAVALGDRIVSRGRLETYPLRLPLSPRERLAFARAGLRVQRAVAEFRKAAAPIPGEALSARHERVLRFRGEETFADFLGDLPEQVLAIFACAAHRATAEPDELSAGCGIGLFAMVWGGKKSTIGRNLVGGPSVLPAKVAAELGDRVRTGAEVTRLREDRELLEVEYRLQGGVRRARSRHVIVAIPAPQAAPVLGLVAPEQSEALASITYGPFLSVAVMTGETRGMPWDGIYAMATPGRSFDMFSNQAQVLHASGNRPAGGSLMLYAGGRHARQLIAESDDVVREVFLRDLYDLYPVARGITVETRVKRWTLGNVFARPGRYAIQPQLNGPFGSRRNVHLAGDYFTELGNMEGSATTGRNAALAVDSDLSKEPTAGIR